MKWLNFVWTFTWGKNLGIDLKFCTSINYLDLDGTEMNLVKILMNKYVKYFNRSQEIIIIMEHY